jgi:hypothetical protein
VGTDAPSSVPSSAPVPEFVEVRFGKFYMSYRSTKTEEPTEEEYNQLVSANEQWYDDLYTTYFENNPDLQFVDIQLVLNETLHGDDATLPSPDYNIYMVSKIQQSYTSAGCFSSYVISRFLFRDMKTPSLDLRVHRRTSLHRLISM